MMPTRLVAATILAVASGWCAAAVPPSVPTPLLDTVTLGDAGSERAHRLTATASEVTAGALGQPARRLLPIGTSADAWAGGSLALTVAVDPDRQNYVTARFWGGDINPNYLILFCQGKQVGYRHLGDVDVLALPDEAPRYTGRFYYVTTPLPLPLTHGRSTVELEVRATGPIWGYGGTFDKYQKPMTVPARNVYRFYVHTDGAFTPPADERQGEQPPASAGQAPGRR